MYQSEIKKLCLKALGGKEMKKNNILKGTALSALALAIGLATSTNLKANGYNDFEVFGYEDVDILNEPVVKEKIIMVPKRVRVNTPRTVVRPTPVQYPAHAPVQYPAQAPVHYPAQPPVAQAPNGYGNSNNNRNHGGVQIVKVNAQAKNDNVSTQETKVSNNAVSKLLNQTRVSTNAMAVEKLDTSRLQSELALRNKVNSFNTDPCVTSHCQETVTVKKSVVHADDVYVKDVRSSVYVGASNSRWSISPIIGYRFLNSGYCWKPTSAVGFGVALEGKINRAMSVEASGQYSKHNMETNHANVVDYYGGYNLNNVNFNDSYSMSTYDFNANLILGMQARSIKPYVVTGLSYIHSDYSDINDSYTTQASADTAWLRATNNYALNLGIGADFNTYGKLNLGLRYTYQMPLNSANQNAKDTLGDGKARSMFTLRAGINF